MRSVKMLIVVVQAVIVLNKQEILNLVPRTHVKKKIGCSDL